MYLGYMYRLVLCIVLFSAGCTSSVPTTPEQHETPSQDISTGVELIVLGNVQDAGSPHAGCRKECCRKLFDQPDPERAVVSLGLIDHDSGKSYLFEASPDLSRQMKALKNRSGSEQETPNGIFLTHAHIGHYSGLMYLGREAMNADHVPVYAMPRMKQFLSENGPWDQLIQLGNIRLEELDTNRSVTLSPKLSVQPILVPHRDEYSETVGFLISGPRHKALFIPDIDKWEKWDQSLIAWIKQVDYAFIDATFYDGEEINHRNISEIPHPFVIETTEKLRDLPVGEKAKVQFIHFNHTNPLLRADSEQSKTVGKNGFGIARMGMTFPL